VSNKNGESLDLLYTAYANLVKAGKDSLTAAYQFGQVVDALYGYYSYEAMGREIGRSASTVQIYRKLFLHYPHEGALQETAQKLGTFDVSKLAGRNPAVPVHWAYHCTNCGSSAIVREKAANGQYVPVQHDPVPATS